MSVATQTVIARAATGRTVTGKLFSGVSSDTVVQSVSGTELTNDKGSYSFAFTDAPAGEYRLTIFDDTLAIPIANWRTKLDAATGNYDVYEKADTRDIAAGTVDIQSRIPTSLDGGNMRSSVQSMAANTLTASALAADAVAEIAAAIGGGTGTGARTVTITVNDGTTVLQNAIVRLSQGVENYVGTTNSSGVVVFAVDDATWDVAITKSGYRFTPTTLVVDGAETRTYSMTARAFTPSDATKVTGYWTVLGVDGEAAAGVIVTVRAVRVQSGSAGLLHVKTARTATTDSEGIAEFANMLPGWSYSVSLDGLTIATVTIPGDAVESNSIRQSFALYASSICAIACTFASVEPNNCNISSGVVRLINADASIIRGSNGTSVNNASIRALAAASCCVSVAFSFVNVATCAVNSATLASAACLAWVSVASCSCNSSRSATTAAANWSAKSLNAGSSTLASGCGSPS